MLRAMTPNRAIVFIVDGFILYWLAALFIPADILRDVFNSLCFGIAVIITITWAPSAFKAVKQGASTGDWVLILAIFLVWLTVLEQRVWSIIFNYFDRPMGWLDLPISGFFPYSYMVAGMLFLAAPGIQPEGFRHTAMWAMIAAASVGSLVAGILIGMNISTIF